MNDDPEQNSEYIDLPEDRSESEIEHDRQIEKIDSFLAGLQPGVSLLIERLQPSWCSGLLEEITVPEESLTLEYFIENWGGHVLSVKVRGKSGRLGGINRISLKSYPPLVYGELLEKPNPMDKYRKEADSNTERSVIVNQKDNLKDLIAAIPIVLPLVFKYIENQQNKQQANMQMMMTLVNNNNNNLGNIAQLGSAFSQLRDVFKAENINHQYTDDTDFMAQAMDVLKIALGGGNNHQRPALVEGSSESNQMISPPPPKRGIPKKNNVTMISERKKSLSQEIADLDPHTAVETVQRSLGAMSPDKRQLVIDKFLSDFYSDMDNDMDNNEKSDDHASNVK